MSSVWPSRSVRQSTVDASPPQRTRRPKKKGHHPVRMMALWVFLAGRVHHPLAAGAIVTPTPRTTTTLGRNWKRNIGDTSTTL